MTDSAPGATDVEALRAALAAMRSALQILDTIDTAPDVGAHLQTAIDRLDEVISDIILAEKRA